jgi:RNA polymerase sigma factor (sigma-70 family)
LPGLAHLWETLVSDSTTYWLRQLKAGNRQAAQELWERYYWRIVQIARKRLNGRATTKVIDESDIAQSAFASFYRAAEQGRFPQLDDRSDLWRLLLVITRRKASRQLRRENCRKRRPASTHSARFDDAIKLDNVADDDPTPEFCLMAVESLQQLLDQLEDQPLRTIALMKMEGYTNEEIARRIGCSLSTVERKLRRIRHEWASVELKKE